MLKKKQLTDDQLEKVSGGFDYLDDCGGILWKYERGQSINIDYYFFIDHPGKVQHRAVLTIVGKGYRPGYYIDGKSAGWYEEDEFDVEQKHSEKEVVRWLD